MGIILVSIMTSCQNNSKQEFNKEFVHSVYIWLKNPDSASDRAAFEKSLMKFLKDSKYAETNYV